MNYWQAQEWKRRRAMMARGFGKTRIPRYLGQNETLTYGTGASADTVQGALTAWDSGQYDIPQSAAAGASGGNIQGGYNDAGQYVGAGGNYNAAGDFVGPEPDMTGGSPSGGTSGGMPSSGGSPFGWLASLFGGGGNSYGSSQYGMPPQAPPNSYSAQVQTPSGTYSASAGQTPPASSPFASLSPYLPYILIGGGVLLVVAMAKKGGGSGMTVIR